MCLASHWFKTSCLFWFTFSTGRTMATMPPVKSDEYHAHLCTFQQSIRDGVGETYTKSKDAHWKIWDSHCEEFGLDPFLKSCKRSDPPPHNLCTKISIRRDCSQEKNCLSWLRTTFLTSCATLSRRSPPWGPLTPGFLQLMERLILDYADRKEAGKEWPPFQAGQALSGNCCSVTPQLCI